MRLAPAGAMITRQALAGLSRFDSLALMGQIRAGTGHWGPPGVLCPWPSGAGVRSGVQNDMYTRGLLKDALSAGPHRHARWALITC